MSQLRAALDRSYADLRPFPVTLGRSSVAVADANAIDRTHPPCPSVRLAAASQPVRVLLPRAAAPGTGVRAVRLLPLPGERQQAHQSTSAKTGWALENGE